MKHTKKILALLLTLSMLIGIFSVNVFAKDEKQFTIETLPNPENPINKYPYVLVHGIFGWGEKRDEAMGTSYWGFNKEKNMANDLRTMGYEVYTATVAPASSAWDRACELYAQLTGTVTDYGEAHSKQCGHERFGRDYSSSPLMGKAWNINSEKINLITHSFGGATAIVLASMLEYGVEEEKQASQENVSALFEGGHGGAIYSVSAGSSPTNGTPLANILNDSIAPVTALGFVLNVLGVSGKLFDPMLDQWGLSVAPDSEKKAKLNPIGLLKLVKSKDHAAYDMTIRGARELNEKFPTAKHTYWISSTCTSTEQNKMGVHFVTKNTTGTQIFMVTGAMISLTYGRKIDGVKIDKEWTQTDGFVPIVSARYPFGAQNENYEGQAVQPGVWYVLPNIQSGKGHGFHNSYGKTEESEKITFDFYRTVFDIVEKI